MISSNQLRVALSFAFVICVTGIPARGSLPISPLARDTPVDFDREVLPFLRDNCLSCHSQTTTKGALNLETPELMLKGGEGGPAIVPGKAAESLLMQAAAHVDADLKMPPKDNKAKAKDLGPEQLALLKLWIDQGAKRGAKADRLVEWQPVPDTVNAIIAAAVTRDGQFAACSRANRLAVYHLPTGRRVANEEAHRDQANALAFSPDGTLLASAGYREVKLWRRTKETQKLTLTDTGALAAVSGDGKWLATADEKGTVKLWEFPAGKPGAVITAASGAITAMGFSSTSAKLACAAQDKSVTLWNVADGQPLAKVATPADVAALAWIGDKLATSGADGAIHIWSDALAPIKELKGHSGAVSALAAREALLFSAGADGIARVWDVEKGQSTIQVAHGAPLSAVAIRADGKRFASAGANKFTKLWDAAGNPVAELKGHRHLQDAADERDRALQIATATGALRKTGVTDAEKALKAAQDQIKKTTDAVPVKQTELEAKQKAATEAEAAKVTAEQALIGVEAELKKATEALPPVNAAADQSEKDLAALKAATPPDAAAIEKAKADVAAKKAAAAKAKTDREALDPKLKQAKEKSVAAVKAATDAAEATKRAEAARRAADTDVTSAKAEEQKATAAIPEAKALADAAEAARKKSEEEATAAKKTAAEADQPIKTIAFSPDNLVLVTAGDDQSIHTWSAETGVPIEVLPSQKSPIASIAFAPSGELVSAAADRSLAIWDLTISWKLERTIGTGNAGSPFVDRVSAVAFSRDGKVLATGGGEPSRGGELKLWNPATGELVRDLPNIHSDAVLALDFSPDDKFLLSGAADRMARVVDLATGKQAKSFEGHTQHVLGVSWSPDGRTIATAGADNTVKLWDWLTGDRKKSIDGYEKEVTGVLYTGAGAQLVTSSGDNKVRLLNADGGQVRVFAEIPEFMNTVAATADGKLVLAGGYDSTLRVWTAADGKPLAQFPPEKR